MSEDFKARLLSVSAVLVLPTTGFCTGAGAGGGTDATGFPVLMASYSWTMSEIDVLRVARGRESAGGTKLLVVGVLGRVAELSTDFEGKTNID